MRTYNKQNRISREDLKSVCMARSYNLNNPCRGCQFENEKPCTDYIDKYHSKPYGGKGKQNGT